MAKLHCDIKVLIQRFKRKKELVQSLPCRNKKELVSLRLTTQAHLRTNPALAWAVVERRSDSGACG